MALDIGNTSALGDNPLVPTLTLDNNRVAVLCGLAMRDDTTFVGITYGGVAMTQALAVTNGATDLKCYLYYLDNATSGSNDFVFLSDGDFWSWGIAVSGLDLSSVDATGSAEGTSTVPTCSVTTVAANTLIVDVVYHKNSGTLTQGGSQVLIAEDNVRSDSDEAGGSYQISVSAGAKQMTWSIGASDAWLIAAASFKVAADTAGIMTPRRGYWGDL